MHHEFLKKKVRYLLCTAYSIYRLHGIVKHRNILCSALSFFLNDLETSGEQLTKNMSIRQGDIAVLGWPYLIACLFWVIHVFFFFVFPMIKILVWVLTFREEWCASALITVLYFPCFYEPQKWNLQLPFCYCHYKTACSLQWSCHVCFICWHELFPFSPFCIRIEPMQLFFL